jgi:type IV pilus assembly protein PilP
MKKIILIVLSISACLFCTTFYASAAEGKNAPPAKVSSIPVAVQPQVSVQKPLTPPAASTSESTYNYYPLGKIDPFKPFVEEEIMTIKKKEAEKKVVPSIFPLQKLEVDKFRIVGIAGDQNRRTAMAEDAAKKYYPLVIGTHIGLHKGKVMEILPDRVIVEEFETKKAKRIILRLHKNQNEVKP